MIVDFLHSFYRMPVNLVVGGVPTTATIRWYKAPAGAKYLPFPTTFFSHVWDSDQENFPADPGEVGYPRTWDPGRNPGYQGQCYIGDPSWFATGHLPALPLPAPGPCVCQIPPAGGAGALVLAGSAQAQHPTCQPVFTPAVDVPKLDLGDGLGLQAMTQVSGVPEAFYRPTPTLPQPYFVVLQNGPSCMGHPAQVYAGGSDTQSGVASPFALVWYDASSRIGTWRWPNSFLYPAGFSVRIYQ